MLSSTSEWYSRSAASEAARSAPSPPSHVAASSPASSRIFEQHSAGSPSSFAVHDLPPANLKTLVAHYRVKELANMERLAAVITDGLQTCALTPAGFRRPCMVAGRAVNAQRHT